MAVMYKTIRYIVPALAIALTVSSCGTIKRPLPPTYPEQYIEQTTVKRDHVEKALLQSANKIERSLRVLAEIKNAERLSTMDNEQMAHLEWQSRTTPQGMGVPISIDDWTGPGYTVIEMIATMTGYTLKPPYGALPPRMPNVVVNSVNRPAVDVLRDVATQMNGIANVRVISASKTIEVHYGAKR